MLNKTSTKQLQRKRNDPRIETKKEDTQKIRDEKYLGAIYLQDLCRDSICHFASSDSTKEEE